VPSSISVRLPGIHNQKAGFGNAVMLTKYLAQAQEQADLSDIDFEELDSDEEEYIDPEEILQSVRDAGHSDEERPKKKRKA
jgi:hypothetical protein